MSAAADADTPLHLIHNAPMLLIHLSKLSRRIWKPEVKGEPNLGKNLLYYSTGINPHQHERIHTQPDRGSCRPAARAGGPVAGCREYFGSAVP